jgi:signal transduction histidine kinase
VERAEEYTGRLGEIAQQALKEMRLLVYQLRPLVLKREGLVGALQQRLDAVEKRAGVDARLLVEGPLELPASVEEGLYRIAQEALNNALKHAAPRAVTLRIDVTEDRVGLEVVDDGQGFDPAGVEGSGGMGLTSMRERAERLGGSLSVRSAPGHGTTVRVEVEVEDD